MENRTKTMARNALKMANVVRYDENCHTLIDVSLLMALPDCELLACRNVGGGTMEAIRELKKILGGLSLNGEIIQENRYLCSP